MCLDQELSASPADAHSPGPRSLTSKACTAYVILSKTIVAWIRSPPPRPLLPEAAAVMV